MFGSSKRFCGAAAVAVGALLAVGASGARAQVTYNSGLFLGSMGCSPANSGTDACEPASGTATFSVISPGILVLTLTDTTANAWQTSQDIGAFSFEATNGGNSGTNLVFTGFVQTGQSISFSSALNGTISGTSNTVITTNGWVSGGTGNMQTGAPFSTIEDRGLFFNKGVTGGGGLGGIVGPAPGGAPPRRPMLLRLRWGV